MNKKTLLTCFLSLGIIGSGTIAYTSLSSAQEVKTAEAQNTEIIISSTSQDQSITSTESNTTPVSSSQEVNSVMPSSTSEESSQQVTPLEKEQEEFVEEAVKQDFYLEEPDANGKLTYVKATDEKVKELTEDAENNKVSIYQVEYNGEMISVLSTTN